MARWFVTMHAFNKEHKWSRKITCVVSLVWRKILFLIFKSQYARVLYAHFQELVWSRIFSVCSSLSSKNGHMWLLRWCLLKKFTKISKGLFYLLPIRSEFSLRSFLLCSCAEKKSRITAKNKIKSRNKMCTLRRNIKSIEFKTENGVT